MRNVTLFFLIGCLVWIGACAPAAEQDVENVDTTEADIEAINNFRDELVAAHNRNDAAGVADLFTADAVLMSPNQPAQVGKQAIESLYQGAFDQNTAELTLASDQTEVTGDWAFDRGTYAVTLTPKAGGEAVQDNGKYLVLLQRQADGSWRLTHDISNSDNPPPGQ